MTPLNQSSVAEITGRVTTVFAHDLQVVPPATDTDLFETSALDSLSFVTLLAGLEREFGLRIPVDTLDLDHFSSIDAIARFLIARPEAADAHCGPGD